VAQFETRQFQEAKGTFSTLVDLAPDDFKSHYHLGITYKRLADVAEEALVDGKGFVGASAITSWRQQAGVELERSLGIYKTAFEIDGYSWWRLHRNIGWLKYQLSNGCADRRQCEDALNHLDRALKGDGRFRGNPDYILAYRSLARIHLKLGDRPKAKEILNEGIRRHQAMVDRNDFDAWKTENRYVYTEAAAISFTEQRMQDGFDLLFRVTRVIPFDSFKNDRLDGVMLAELQRAAAQSRSLALTPPPAPSRRLERD